MKRILPFLLLTLLATACHSDSAAGSNDALPRASSMNLGPPLYPVQLVTALDKLIARDCPATANAERESWKRYTEWLSGVRNEVDALRKQYEEGRPADPSAADAHPFSRHQPYLELQNRVALQSTRFQPMGDALRARHDEVIRTLGHVR